MILRLSTRGRVWRRERGVTSVTLSVLRSTAPSAALTARPTTTTVYYGTEHAGKVSTRGERGGDRGVTSVTLSVLRSTAQSAALTARPTTTTVYYTTERAGKICIITLMDALAHVTLANPSQSCHRGCYS